MAAKGAAASSRKLKLLHLLDVLRTETDDEHGLSSGELIARLAERDVEVERKALYRDLKALGEFGYKVEQIPGKPPTYALVEREFDLTDLQFLVDAVQSSRFLDEETANRLVGSLCSMASNAQAEELVESVVSVNSPDEPGSKSGAATKSIMHVAGRIGADEDSVFSDVDVLKMAIRSNAKVSFKYFNYNLTLKHAYRNGGEPYHVSPLGIIFSRGFYYLAGYSDEREGIRVYRIDRIDELTILDEPCVRNKVTKSFNPHEYVESAFNMFGGDPVKVTLEVQEGVMNAIVDRFGKGVKPYGKKAPKGWTQVSVPIRESGVFYGWLVQFKDKVRVVSPAEVAEGYQEYLQEILQFLEDDKDKGEEPAE